MEPLRASAPLREITKPASPLSVTVARRAYGVARAARLVGIHPTQLSYILHGQRKPNDALRPRLARMGITHTVDGEEI